MTGQARAVARHIAASRRPRRLAVSHPVLLLAAVAAWCGGGVAETPAPAADLPAPSTPSTPSAPATPSGAAATSAPAGAYTRPLLGLP